MTSLIGVGRWDIDDPEDDFRDIFVYEDGHYPELIVYCNDLLEHISIEMEDE